MNDQQQDNPDSIEDQIQQLQRENRRLQRSMKRYETQLQHLDKMAAANEKISINLYNEIDVVSKQLEAKNKQLEIENRRKARELEEARRLQLAMLPKTLPEIPELEIAVYMKTATEVGGDYYDFHIGENSSLTFVLGDATGHGLKAGTMVTATKSLFSSLAKNPDILSTFHEMSESIKKMNLPYLTMCLVMVKLQNGIMNISSAGIPPALVYRCATKELEELSLDGMPLGAIKNFPYRQETLKLEPGDCILLMSDGFPELMNDKDEMLDYPKAFAAFREVGEKRPKEIITYLVKTGMDWANGRPQDDDITFVVIKVM